VSEESTTNSNTLAELSSQNKNLCHPNPKNNSWLHKMMMDVCDEQLGV
jgi:hypothetical protein